MKKVIEALAQLLNMDADEVLTQVSTPDGTALLPEEEVATKVAELVKGQIKNAKDEQHKRGKREQDEAIARALKAHGFTNPEKLKGTDMIEAFVAHTQEANGGGGEGKEPATLTKEEAAKLPAVKALVTERLAAAEQKYNDLMSEYDGFKKRTQMQTVQSVGKSEVAEILRRNGAILEAPGAGVSADDRLNAFTTKMIDWSRVALNDKGKPYLVDENGEPDVDEFGKPRDFEKFVIGEAKPIFGFNKQDPNKGGAGAGKQNNAGKAPGAGGTGGEGESLVFADAKEYSRYMANEPDAKKRFEATKAWSEQVDKGGEDE